MRIAIFHDYFDEIGGAEITFLILARELKAPVITTSIDREKISQLGYDDVRFISLGRVPSVRNVKQAVAKWKFHRCDFSRRFDLFVLGGFCSIFAAKRHKNNLWYCFSPERGLYDLRYLTTPRYNLIIQGIKSVLIVLDCLNVKDIKQITAPSQRVMSRIKVYYNRESTLIYPPVSTSRLYYRPHKNYWLSVVRISPYKRLELQLKAFVKLPEERLIIAGTCAKENTDYYLKLKKMCAANVDFIGAVYDPGRLSRIYSQCKGFITTSQDEDFGMTPVEAMASGKPVIAPNEGGYKETVIDGVTGKLITDIDVDKLVQAIKEIGENPEKYKSACLEQAKKFDAKIFIEKIKQKIEDVRG